MVEETRSQLRLRSALTRGAVALTCFVALSGFGSWFGRPLVNGYYVSRGSNTSVVMAHLVEAPRGHLSGALVSTTVDQGASSPRVRRVTVQGSIAGGNITLKTPGLFGAFSTLYIGTLDGGRLSLSRQGHSAFTLYLASARAYQARLATLGDLQANLNTSRSAQHLLKNAIGYVKQLNVAIEQYLPWGRARIAHQANVRTYWQRKAKFYDTCLATIRPLAAEGVPVWRWQGCAITVSNDAYFREQAVAAITSLQRTAREKRAAIAQMLTEAPIRVKTALHTLIAACRYTAHPRSCVTACTRAEKGSLVPPARLAAFRALLPQVGQAIRNDAQTAETSDARLKTVAAEIARIYRTPQNYRRT